MKLNIQKMLKKMLLQYEDDIKAASQVYNGQRNIGYDPAAPKLKESELSV